MEKKLTDEKAMFNYIANTILGAVKPIYLRKRIVNEIIDLIHRLQEESKDLRQKKNELQTLIRESRHSQSTAKEILQAMFYFLDGNSFWLEETGREVEYVKLDDALEFMRKQAKEYGVEVE